jgi:hypothetical protein
LPISVADPEFLLAMKKTGAVPAPEVLFPGKWGLEKEKVFFGFCD